MLNYIYVQVAIEITASVVLVVLLSATYSGRKVDEVRTYPLFFLMVFCTILLLGDTFAIYYDGVLTRVGMLATRIGNFLVFFMPPLLAIYAVEYLYRLIEDKKGRPGSFCIATIGTIGLIFCIYTVLSQFTHWIYYIDGGNVYHRRPGFIVAVALGALLLIILFILLIQNRGNISRLQFWSFMAFCLLPFGTNIFQFFHYGISFNNIAIAFAVFLLFASYHVEGAGYILIQKDRILQKELSLSQQRLAITQRDKELAEKRVQISISQMQPHFIFNSLGSIEHLCRVNPAEAAEATHHFARYLRSNINALSRSDLIPFSEEMQHIRTYVWLEEMRFGDDLDFQEDIQVSDFELPALSVQPLVENAIKHGMERTEGVLTVRIITREEESCYRVTISDNGGGFDVNQPTSDDRAHIGVSNVAERIKLMSQGTFHIDSKIGAGTTVTITIPKIKTKNSPKGL
ncbi:MAG: histidine kinase [Ruminiclostridium sp.]|nr:histidine kinase [Ruminiclostridium sp.]